MHTERKSSTRGRAREEVGREHEGMYDGMSEVGRRAGGKKWGVRVVSDEVSPSKAPCGDMVKRIRGVEASRGNEILGLGTRPLAVPGHLTRARGLHRTSFRGLGTWMPGDQVLFGRLRTAG